jgi:hypothetical protein
VSARITRFLLAVALGVSAALLVSCGGSSGKLIPVADAGPLQTDFEAIAQEAESADGDCSGTEAAIAKTEQDFSALPRTLDAGLRATLRQGIENLRARALVLCHQPLAQTTSTNSTPTVRTTHTTTTPPTQTQTTTPTSTTPTTSTPTNSDTTPTPEGGTPAPGAGEAEQQAAPGGGTGVGGSEGKPGEAAGGAEGGGQGAGK